MLIELYTIFTEITGFNALCLSGERKAVAQESLMAVSRVLLAKSRAPYSLKRSLSLFIEYVE